MPARLVNAAVVLTARQFNPSIFTQLWVQKTLGLPTEEFQPNMVTVPHLASIPTARFHLLVIEERLQFTLAAAEAAGSGDLVRDMVGRIVDELPHTPFGALGLNLDWRLDVPGQTPQAVTRNLFFSSGQWLASEFDVPDAAFGMYLSRDALGCRLRLNAQPLTETNLNVADGNTTVSHFVVFSFNYNVDLPKSPESGAERVVQIKAALGRWQEAVDEGVRIVQLAESRVAQ